MTKIRIVILILLVGIAASAAFLFHPRGMIQWLNTTYKGQDVQGLRLEIPDASWEPIFFKDINSVARFSNQPDLRTTNLSGTDFEVRVWWGFGLSPLEGVTLRHVGGQWSATHVKADKYYEPNRANYEELRPPKSGWEAIWKQLADAGILTLPDASELNCNVGGLDGIAYVVETNKEHIYRTYMYDFPSEAKCNEAKQMTKIVSLIFEEFNLGKSQD